MNLTLWLSRLPHGVAVAVLAVGALVPGVAAEAQTRAALVRDVDTGALQPFRELISVSANPSESFKFVNGPVVPAGKRLVIENVSVWALMYSSSDDVTGLWLTVQGVPTFAMMDPNSTERKILSGPSKVAAYNRVVKLYYNAGETVQLQVYFEGTAGSKLVNVYLNGYYVTL